MSQNDENNTHLKIKGINLRVVDFHYQDFALN